MFTPAMVAVTRPQCKAGACFEARPLAPPRAQYKKPVIPGVLGSPVCAIEIGKAEAVHRIGHLCVGDRCFRLIAA
jgi:hypothetical protein